MNYPNLELRQEKKWYDWLVISFKWKNLNYLFAMTVKLCHHFLLNLALYKSIEETAMRDTLK